MNVGDVRQIVFLSDSMTELRKIVRTVKRKDGLDVFAEELTVGTARPDTLYYLIRDGFFMATELDSGSNPVNPFREQRLARINPTNGENWKHTLGYTDTTYFYTKYIGEQQALCGTFPNVYGFILTNTYNGILDTIMTIFYAPNVGYIGTDIDKDFRHEVSTSYVKVGDQVFGSQWPARNPSPDASGGSQFKRRTLATYSLMGRQTPANQSLKLTENTACFSAARFEFTTRQNKTQ
jgi:hypothetical protein